jgi:hypothetical protein
MLLGGLWHGANWTFVVWGGLHGIFLIVNHAWDALAKRLDILDFGFPFLFKVLSWTVTFSAVVFAWVFFRASNLSSALDIVRGMIGFNGVVLPSSLSGCCGAFAVLMSDLGVQFKSGVLSINGAPVGSFAQFAVLITVSAALVWCPNSQQLVARFERKSSPISAYATVTLGSRSGVCKATGALLGTVFFVCLLMLNRKAEFLYFQF